MWAPSRSRLRLKCCNVALTSHVTGDKAFGAYYFAAALAVVGLVVEFFVDKRNPELTVDARFDLGIAFFAYAVIRLESTREMDNLYFRNEGWALASDLFFFFGFVGAKLTSASASREVRSRLRLSHPPHRWHVSTKLLAGTWLCSPPRRLARGSRLCVASSATAMGIMACGTTALTRRPRRRCRWASW